MLKTGHLPSIMNYVGCYQDIFNFSFKLSAVRGTHQPGSLFMKCNAKLGNYVYHIYESFTTIMKRNEIKFLVSGSIDGAPNISCSIHHSR